MKLLTEIGKSRPNYFDNNYKLLLRGSWKNIDKTDPSATSWAIGGERRQVENSWEIIRHLFVPSNIKYHKRNASWMTPQQKELNNIENSAAEISSSRSAKYVHCFCTL